ncbi:MAG: hypothetical protein AMXMBFR67_12780 [Nitrospira sp.]
MHGRLRKGATLKLDLTMPHLLIRLVLPCDPERALGLDRPSIPPPAQEKDGANHNPRRQATDRLSP